MVRASASLLLVALLQGCASSKREEPEVRSWNGVYLTVHAQDPESAIGKPLRVRLVLKNSGSQTMYYDAQGVSFHSFDLQGPGGCSALQIAEHGQTFGFLKPIAPAESVTLLDQYDLATEYLIEQAGVWRVRFCSYVRLSEQERSDRDSMRMISDWIEVTVREGKPAPWMEVARRLYDARRPKWHLTAGGSAAGIYATFRSPTYVFSPPFKKIHIQIGSGESLKNAERLGSTQWGDLFCAAEWRDAEKEWPGYRSTLLAALNRP